MCDYHYDVMPTPANPADGWSVRLYVHGKLVGGRVVPVREYVTAANPHDAARRAALAAGAEWVERMTRVGEATPGRAQANACRPDKTQNPR